MPYIFHLGVNGLVIGLEEPGGFALIRSNELEGPPDRLTFRFGRSLFPRLLQRRQARERLVAFANRFRKVGRRPPEGQGVKDR